MKGKANNKKLIILRTIESFYPFMTGPANQAYRISLELEKRGIGSPILTTDYKSKGRPAREKYKGVKVWRFPIKWKIMKYFFTPEMKKALSKGDIIHSHSYRGYQTQIAYKMARKRGVPFVISNHGTFISYKTFVKGWKRIPYMLYDIFFKKIVLDADTVFVNTTQEKKEALEFGVDEKKLRVIPFGINVDDYTPLNKGGKILNLLWVGRVTKDRNIEMILRALVKLENVKLKVVGNEFKRTESDIGGELERLKDLALEIGVTDKVEFIPWTAERANKEFRSADVFVYTSVWENLGQTILEAAAAGLPLVCTKVGIAQDLVDTKTGSFVKVGDTDSIVRGVKKFSSLKSRKEAEKRLREKVRKNFSWESIIQKYINVYGSLI